MLGRKLYSGTVGKISYETRECYGEHINLLTARGPVWLEDRHAVYRKIAKANPSSTIITVMDNRRGYEDEISFEDIVVLINTLQSTGIQRMIGVAVTKESAYRNIVKLSHAVADLKDFEIISTSTNCIKDAKQFLLSQLQGASSLSFSPTNINAVPTRY